MAYPLNAISFRSRWNFTRNRLLGVTKSRIITQHSEWRSDGVTSGVIIVTVCLFVLLAVTPRLSKILGARCFKLHRYCFHQHRITQLMSCINWRPHESLQSISLSLGGDANNVVGRTKSHFHTRRSIVGFPCAQITGQ